LKFAENEWGKILNCIGLFDHLRNEKRRDSAKLTPGRKLDSRAAALWRD
jgi:hypothetical protein